MDLYPSGFPNQRIEVTTLDLLKIWENKYEKLNEEQRLRFLKDAELSGLLEYSEEILYLAFRNTPKFKVALHYIEAIKEIYYDPINRFSEEGLHDDYVEPPTNEDFDFEVSEDVEEGWSAKWH